MNFYLMVAKNGEHEIIINKSRFICHVKRVYNQQDAKQFIADIKKQHPHANHNCSAYQIGDFDEIQKAHDDGEPSQTAGVPMLEVLRKQGIKNCVVVVTRYFGGIKLGAGGLIRAYGQAVSEAIKSLGIIERKTMQTMFVHTDYSLLGTLQNRLGVSDYLLKEIHYRDRVTLEVIVAVDMGEMFSDWITDVTHGKVKIEEGAISYQEIPLIKS